MKNFHFINGLLISSFAFGAAACSSSTTTPAAVTTGDASTGGTTGSTGGTTGSTGGTTGSTGGTTGSTGGTTGSTGGTTGNTDGGAGLCSDYCAESLLLCTGDAKQFDTSAACMTACAKFPTTGKTGDASGDTIQCRLTHLGFIEAAEPDAGPYGKLHCPHTGVTPTAFCK